MSLECNLQCVEVLQSSEGSRLYLLDMVEAQISKSRGYKQVIRPGKGVEKEWGQWLGSAFVCKVSQ